MGDHVLDLIDNVVAEHELLSADAMRWAPDEPDPTPPSPTVVQRFIRDAIGVELTAWQRRVMDLVCIDETHIWRADEFRRHWLNDTVTEEDTNR